AMSLDPTTNSIILFGGTGVCGTPCPDTWSLSAGVWTNLTGTLTVSPSARSDATSMYDPVSGSLLLFGGHAPALFNDTWRYSASGWTNLTLSLSTAPAPSYGSAAAFDPADGYAVVVGGRTPNGLRAAVWAFIEPLGARLLVSSPIVAPGSSVIFTSTIVGGVGPYRTLIDPGDGTIPAYATVLTHTYTTAGNYSATVSTTDARGVGARIALNISVVAYPLHVSLMAHPAVATPRQPLTLTAFVTGGTAPYTFSWSGLPSPCLSANLASLSCSPQNIGSYAVTVTVTDAGNAKSTAVSNFTVTPLSASTSGPFVPSVGGSLISRVGWNIVPAIIAAMGMSAVAAFLMYREAKTPAPEPAALPERPMCYIPPEWSETPDEFT
ncbi:MAG: hypothetical protein L3J96_00870, partial [Thermoplasmata archaeon]|nr:hypothetical protein [Thermoplasmata archaeon]